MTFYAWIVVPVGIWSNLFHIGSCISIHYLLRICQVKHIELLIERDT